tara:strand:+ start:1473 stop:1811 length:339 start_codon:yes stop_codon:yes gene_type:complete
MINWELLTSIDQVDYVASNASDDIYVVLKHSTRCSISSMAKNRLEQKWNQKLPVSKVFFLDLIQYRHVSDYIASMFNIVHESPQLLLFKNGKVIYHASHNAISVSQLEAQLL